MDPFPGIGPMIIRGGEAIIRFNPNLSEEDRAAIRVASHTVAATIDLPGTAISVAVRAVRSSTK